MKVSVIVKKTPFGDENTKMSVYNPFEIDVWRESFKKFLKNKLTSKDDELAEQILEEWI